MARVTKINVGGTNYDIAHEGELKNSGFEVVSSLPTTNLFEGRQVTYNGQLYVYNGSQWVNVNAPYEAKLQWGGDNFSNGGSPIDASMIPSLGANRSAYMPAECIDVEYSRDGGETWVEYPLSDLDKSKLFSVGGRITIGNYMQDNTTPTSLYQTRITLRAKTYLYSYLHKFYIEHSVYGSSGAKLSLSAAKSNSTEFELIGSTRLDSFPGSAILNTPSILVGNRTNCYDRLRFLLTIESSEPTRGLQVYLIGCYGGEGWNTPSGLASRGTIYSLGAKQEVTFPNSVISQETVNFDVNNIEPTQTGNVTKTSTWLWQYLVQAVNWLKANNVRVSDTKLDKRAYNQIYTNCGYTNITSSTTGALIIELPFAPSSDYNNSMTYIELNVYSHKKGCSKYIIGVYSYAVSSQYEWSVYSYMGYNYFSSITQARRTDNNNIVIVLGNFTDVHKNEHFSISRIVTGFNRNNDDTDGFLLYTDSNSNNYSTLISSTYISPIISYNDLTDKPNLATVATSGSYNDLTDTPTLAAVATSGDYNDLLNRPAFSGSYNDLTDTPTIPSTFADLNGSIDANNQISDLSIANSKLANSSMSLNGITVNLGDTSILPWYVDYNEVDYPARIRDHWLQIYRNGVWANLMYLGDILPTQVGQITSLDNLDWYNEQVSEYEVDSTTTTSILNGTTKPATLLLNCLAEQLTLNLYPISGKQYGKGSLDSLISDLQGKGFSVFVENDLDAIIGSGSDYLIRIKISKVPTPKAIIECYVAR